MVAPASIQPIGAVHLRVCGNDCGSHIGKFSLRHCLKGFAVDVRMFAKGICSSTHCKLNVACGSTSHALVMDEFSSTSDTTPDNNEKTSMESSLILIRHGESLWNEKNLFTSCVDVPLTKRGIEEAIEAGMRICNIPVDVIYTSTLIRAQMTAMLAMTQHRHKKIPIVTHNESEQAKTWSRIYSEETKKQSIPVFEQDRNINCFPIHRYGELQGLNKEETAERYGKELVHEWRRSYDIPPPNGESLEMCSQRVVAYFKEQIEPHLQSGKHVMVAAHGNSLRSIIMYLDKLTSQEVSSIFLSLLTVNAMLLFFQW
ncbi:hypothetical protein EZV62_015220 [Acer yangbiense]|uniref:phosphoglycerate mutase (2,3-diphosphoglycerate-dependent) n=1 Tax=Acer yangbiense TaxID=1000413 RepID=A0A5C7HU58_9ROSI|nr:hypothetical protein EZV62_015220 [Acer yangbiense]